MLVVETIAKIRRAYFVQKKAIKEICRELKVSRKTVRRVVRSGATEFVYERKVQPQPKIGPWREELDRLLAVNAARASRERLTLIRIFEELRGLGYEGGYDAVRRYAASWQRERAAATAAAFVPLSFAPGEAYQFDWSHEIVLIAGVTVTVKVAQVRLCHSRMLFVRAYPRESQEMVLDAHDRAFAFFRGACTRGIYDNMKTAVDAILVGKDRVYNRRLSNTDQYAIPGPRSFPPSRRGRPFACRPVSARCLLSVASRFPLGFSPSPASKELSLSRSPVAPSFLGSGRRRVVVSRFCAVLEGAASARDGVSPGSSPHSAREYGKP
jgi:transposase